MTAPGAGGRLTALLDAAREARRAGDGAAAIARLGEAVVTAREAGDEAGLQVAAWRLAKAHHDFGTAEGIVAALGHALATRDPFAHHPPAQQAAEPLTRRVWDTLGYGAPELPALWRAWTAHHAAAGDPWLAVQGAVQGAWHQGCRGDQAALVALTEPWLRLTPARFGRGPTKHPDALDTTLSLYWAHADLARIRLRAATWADRVDLALEARDLMLDAFALADRPLERDAWAVDCLCRAADRFGWSEAPWPAWRRGLTRWSDEAPAHAARGEAILLRRAGRAEQARADLLRAAERAEVEAIGWEWVVDALVEAERTRADPPLAARIRALRDRTSVGIG